MSLQNLKHWTRPIPDDVPLFIHKNGNSIASTIIGALQNLLLYQS